MATGGSAIDPAIVSALIRRAREDDPLAEFTARERDVLALMAEGRSNQGIADRLGVTERAVQKHITSIFDRLGLAGRARTTTGACSPCSRSWAWSRRMTSRDR